VPEKKTRGGGNRVVQKVTGNGPETPRSRKIKRPLSHGKNRMGVGETHSILAERKKRGGANI